MILEEEENVLTEMIRKAAKDKLTEEMQKKLNSESWGECFDVAEELIKKTTPPGHKVTCCSMKSPVTLKKYVSHFSPDGTEEQVKYMILCFFCLCRKALLLKFGGQR